MIRNARLTADEHTGAQSRRPGKADLGCDSRAGADLDVVAHVHVCIELDASREACRPERAGVHSAQSADLHVVFQHDAASVEDSHDLAVRPFRPAEALPANNAERSDDDSRAKAHAPVNDAVLSDVATGADVRPGADDSASADPCRRIHDRSSMHLCLDVGLRANRRL